MEMRNFEDFKLKLVDVHQLVDVHPQLPFNMGCPFGGIQLSGGVPKHFFLLIP